MPTNSVAKSIRIGINFIKNDQCSDGGFESETIQTKNKKDVTKNRTIFFPSLILLSLSNINFLESQKIKQRAIKFISRHHSSNWSFNYWSNPTKHSKSEQYPDDLDDTALALAALEHNMALPGKVIFSVIKNLKQFQKNPGGPYYTWMLRKNRNYENDIAVNANIAYFLSLYDTFPRPLHSFLEKNILTNNFISKYYTDELPVVYFISRFYKGPHTSKIVKLLLRKSIKNNTPTSTALILSSLINLGYKGPLLRKNVLKLLQSQNVNGSWGHSPVGIEKIVNNIKYLSACSSFTTALCVEALNKYVNLKEFQLDRYEESLLGDVMFSVQKKLQSQPNVLQAQINKSLDRLGLANNAQIILLPFWVNKMVKNDHIINIKTVKKISEANLWGWLAYRLYDDLMDGHSNTNALPAANWALLQLCGLYSKIGTEKDLCATFFYSTMEGIESYNASEFNQRNSPPVKNYTLNKNDVSYAKKSLGAALPALEILLLKGFSQNSKTFMYMNKFFNHYLTARQLNDDAHDWEEDLSLGYINPVAALLLKKFLQ